MAKLFPISTPSFLAQHCVKPLDVRFHNTHNICIQKQTDDKLTQTLWLLHDSVQTLKVGGVIVWLCGVVQKRPHRLNLAYCVVTFLLPWCSWCADIYQVVDTVSHCPKIIKFPSIICSCVIVWYSSNVVEVKLHVFWALVLDRGEWSVSWIRGFARSSQERAKMHNDQGVGMAPMSLGIKKRSFFFLRQEQKSSFLAIKPLLQTLYWLSYLAYWLITTMIKQSRNKLKTAWWNHYYETNKWIQDLHKENQLNQW